MEKEYEKLQLENELLNRIIKAMPEYLTYKNKDGVFELASNIADELYKKKLDTIVGRGFEEIFTSKTAKNFKALDDEVYKKKETIQRMVDVETSDGIKQMDATRTPVFDSDGEVQGILSLKRDISSVVKLKDQLSEISDIQNVIIEITKSFVESSLSNFDEIMNDSLAKLGKAVRADRAYIFTYNFKENTMNNTYEWCNKAVPSDMNNQQNITITDYLDSWVERHRKNKSVVISNVQQLDKKSNLYKIHHPRKSKSVLTMPIFVEDVCYGYIGLDSVKLYASWDHIPKQLRLLPEVYAAFIAHKNILVELEEAKQQAQTASNVQSDFIGKMTHEIRTPINGVSNAMFLLADTELNDEQNDYINVMKYSLEVLSNMVSNLLDYSQIEVNKLKHKSSDVNLEDEVIKLIKVNKYMASSKKLGLYLNYDYRLPPIVSTDVEKIRQILNNLIINAIKYTNYGHVEVNLYLLDFKPPYVDVKFEVIDTGIGISEENLNYIFESFYQVGYILNKNPFGTGLGLTIVKDLVSFLKGELHVQSSERVGSNFSFVLTFYTPIEESRQPLDMSALMINLSEGQHSDVEALLSSHFVNTDICTERNIRSFIKSHYDFYFVFINNSEVYHDKLDLITETLKNAHEDIRIILLYDTVKDEIINDSLDLFDYSLEMPETSEWLISQVTKLPKGEAKTAKAQAQLRSIKPKILLVDDNNINRKVMGQLLESMNVEITEAADGFSAVEEVKNNKFDMIFMDILMPGMDGYETTRRIRQLEGVSGSLPILAVTANDPSSTEAKAIEYGMNGVLGKPLYKADLEKLLEQYFGSFKEHKQKKKSKGKISTPDGPVIFDQNEFELFYQEGNIRREIVTSIILDKEKDLNEIMEAFATQNGISINEKVHYMKGSFTYLRAKKCLMLSEVIMNFCKQQMVEEAVLLEDSYITNYLELIEELESYKQSL